jgi:long-chain acyl-CoA synthetase
LTETDWAIARMIREWVVRKPDDPCLICDGVARTWRDVADRTARLAQGLIQHGLEPQDRVMYLGRNSAEFFEILAGSSMAGVVTVALNWRLAPREMVQILNHSGARILFIQTEFLARIEQVRSELGSIELIIEIGTTAHNDGYESWLSANVAEDPLVCVRPDDTAFQMYTSGTTGVPKGVLFNNAAVRSTVDFADLIQVDERAVVLIAMPVFHAVGSSFGIQALSVGGTLVIARDFDAESLLSLIETYRITSAPLVPAALKMLLESPSIDTRDLSSLSMISYSGSPITQELLAAMITRFRCSFIQIYGLTETSLATLLATEDHLDPDHPERRLSAGRAVRGASVRIVDASGQDVADGEFGEVWVRCSTQMAGYWDAPAETAAAITADGYIRTGDGGYLLDGYLYLKDRIKDMIVSGGENVYPIEVENVLISHPSVRDVAVIGVPSEKWGETVKALVVRDLTGPVVEATQLIAYTKQHLAGYKCPTSIDFVPELPRNPSGKVLKRQLRLTYGG